MSFDNTQMLHIVPVTIPVEIYPDTTINLKPLNDSCTHHLAGFLMVQVRQNTQGRNAESRRSTIWLSSTHSIFVTRSTPTSSSTRRFTRKGR